MQQRLTPAHPDSQGVHVAGELLDVFGRIGGFNFYWAFVTGRLAGLAAGSASWQLDCSAELAQH